MFSHPIRGAKGADATDEDIRANNERAINFVLDLFGDIPCPDQVWLPALADEFVTTAYRMGLLTEAEILAVDKAILAKRDKLIVYAPGGEISRGMSVEIEEAKRLGKEISLYTGEDE
jgi:hypothetical protein